MDGFDQHVTSTSDGGNLARRWTGLPDYGTGAGAGPWGTSGIFNGGSTGSGYRTFANTSTLVAGVWFKPISSIVNSAVPILAFADGSTVQVGVGTTSTAGCRAYRNTTANILGTSASSLLLGQTWQRLEVKIVFHASAGSVEVRYNGTQVINVTGVNTIATANAYANRVYIYWTSSDATTPNLDDLYLLDTNSPGPTDFLSDWRVRTLQPNAAGSSAQFTPTSGSNYDRVNDVPPSATDVAYVSSTTVGHIDLHAMADVPTTVSGIQAVAHSIQTRSDDGTPTGTARSKLKSGATTSNGSTVTLTGSYQHQIDIYHTDPNTAGSWSATTVNALEAGYEKVS